MMELNVTREWLAKHLTDDDGQSFEAGELVLVNIEDRLAKIERDEENGGNSSNDVYFLIALCRALESQLAQLREKVTPRPIDEADKTAKRLHLFRPRRGWTYGKWDDQKHHKNPRPYWRTDDSFAVQDDREDQPTHFLLPLPEVQEEPNV